MEIYIYFEFCIWLCSYNPRTQTLQHFLSDLTQLFSVLFRLSKLDMNLFLNAQILGFFMSETNRNGLVVGSDIITRADHIHKSSELSAASLEQKELIHR